MARRKKGFSQRVADITYTKPVLSGRMLELRKGFREIAAMLEVKKKV